MWSMWSMCKNVVNDALGLVFVMLARFFGAPALKKTSKTPPKVHIQPIDHIDHIQLIDHII